MSPLRRPPPDFGPIAPNIALVCRNLPPAVAIGAALDQVGVRLAYLDYPLETASWEKVQYCDVILLEVTAGDEEALKWCATLRRLPGISVPPLIVLGNGLSKHDRLRAYDAGADLVLEQPVSITELVGSIQSLLRLVRPGLDEAILEFGGISVDLNQRRAFCCGNVSYLEPLESRLLTFFMRRPAQVLSRQELLIAVHGKATAKIRSIDVYVARLRKTLGCNDHRGPIRTVPNGGYSLELQNRFSV